MARRARNIYKRKDWRWEGRYIKERVNGEAKYAAVYAKTYTEVKENWKKQRMSRKRSRFRSVRQVLSQIWDRSGLQRSQ